MSTLSTLSKIPWTLLIIIYMVVAHILPLEMGGMAGYVFLVLCLGVLIVEVFKSVDIRLVPFFLDLVSSVVALIIATTLMSYLVFTKGWAAPTFFHWFGVAVIVGDTILSPFIAFRTALRNMNFAQT
jgi:hypothetical protein